MVFRASWNCEENISEGVRMPRSLTRLPASGKLFAFDGNLRRNDRPRGGINAHL